MSTKERIQVNFMESYTYSFFCPRCSRGSVYNVFSLVNVLQCEFCFLKIARWADSDDWFTVEQLVDDYTKPTLFG